MSEKSHGGEQISRRNFLKQVGEFAVGAAVGAESLKSTAEAQERHEFPNLEIVFLDTGVPDKKTSIPMLKKIFHGKLQAVSRQRMELALDDSAGLFVKLGTPRSNQNWEDTLGNAIDRGARRDGEGAVRDTIRRIPGSDRAGNTTDAVLEGTIRKEKKQKLFFVEVKLNLGVKWPTKPTSISRKDTDTSNSLVYFKVEKTRDGAGRESFTILESGMTDPLQKHKQELPEVKNEQQLHEILKIKALEYSLNQDEKGKFITTRINQATTPATKK